MRPLFESSLPKDIAEAIAIQKELAPQIEIYPPRTDICFLTAVDTAYSTDGETVFAAAVTLSFPDLEEIEKRFQFEKVKFPYQPGLFFFREGTAIINVLEKLEQEPDLLIIHGHGIAHPRGIGMASQIGLIFDKMTIGCSRKVLLGSHREVDSKKGSYQPISLNNREVGYAYRSKDGVKPIYISPGHHCDLTISKEIIVKCLRGYRLPEPMRIAHLLVNKYKHHFERKKEAIYITKEQK